MITFRLNEPTEVIVFHAHSGTCRYCGGIVKMRRVPHTLKLEPDACGCLQCGQRYRVEISTSIAEWEAEQWRQKLPI